MLRSKLSKYEGTTPVVRQPAVHEKDDTNAPEVGQAGIPPLRHHRYGADSSSNSKPQYLQISSTSSCSSKCKCTGREARSLKVPSMRSMRACHDFSALILRRKCRARSRTSFRGHELPEFLSAPCAHPECKDKHAEPDGEQRTARRRASAKAT